MFFKYLIAALIQLPVPVHLRCSKIMLFEWDINTPVLITGTGIFTGIQRKQTRKAWSTHGHFRRISTPALSPSTGALCPGSVGTDNISTPYTGTVPGTGMVRQLTVTGTFT